MQIDWITVSAQIVNFLVLVWLLKRFLYRPVMAAIQRRERHINGRLQEAGNRENEAEETVKHYRKKQESLDKEREAVLSAAREEAEEQKKQWLEEARAEVEKMRENWQQQVREERESFLKNLRHQTSESLQRLARKLLAELADSELEAQMIAKFLRRLQDLDPVARKTLRQNREPVRFVTAFTVDEALRRLVNEAVETFIEEKVEIEFIETPEVICGVELSRGGWRLSWNLDDTLQDIGTGLAEAVSPSAGSGREPRQGEE